MLTCASFQIKQEMLLVLPLTRRLFDSHALNGPSLRIPESYRGTSPLTSPR